MIISLIAAIISSGLINSFLSHILYSSKLKKELKLKGPGTLAREIENSLIAFRDLELGITPIEIFQIEDVLSEKGSLVNFFGGECIYPEIFNDWESFDAYREKVRECRTKHEKNLNCRLALNLVFIDRYLMQLSSFMAGNEERLPMWGTIFIFDLQQWQRRVDVLTVREINSCKYKLESHETRKWEKLRKIEVEQQYQNTILSFLLTGETNRKDREFLEDFKSRLITVLTEDNESDGDNRTC